MSVQESGHEEWEESPVRSKSSRFVELMLTGQTIKMIAWITIGIVFISISTIQLVTVYRVPIELLALLFLGQGICAISVRYLLQIDYPAKHHAVYNSME